MNRPFPSTKADFLRHYETHSKVELLHALAELHVTNLEQYQKIQALKKEISDNAKSL